MLSKKYQHQAQRVTIAQDVQNAPQIKQYLYECENPQKVETLLKILENHPSPCTLVFCRTKATVAEIGQRLAKLKVSCDVLHGDLEQPERDRATALFRNGSVRVLVATDVAARGLDVDTLALVVNVDLPSSTDIYIHRIGRTGRAGRKGTAVSIATEYEIPKVAEIEQATGVKMIRQDLGSNKPASFPRDFQTAINKTIQIYGGRSHKLRPGDILGALTSEPQPILAKDIGKIEIFDRFSYVAISAAQAEKAKQKLQNTKIKGSKYKVYLV
jgi:ATP-independent RNA helicase DbpA